MPEKDVAVLAGRYLRIVLIGAPGYATFESGKRYLQAQGLFSASLYVLLICAPLNAFMNWLFVWVCLENHFIRNPIFILHHTHQPPLTPPIDFDYDFHMALLETSESDIFSNSNGASPVLP